MLKERSLDTDTATGLLLDLLFRHVRQMTNPIMAARTTAPAAETPAMRAFETLCLDELDAVMDGNGGLVNAIGGPPEHCQYPILF